MPMTDDDHEAKVAAILATERLRVERYLDMPMEDQLAACEKQLVEYVRAFLQAKEEPDELRQHIEYRDNRIAELQDQVDRVIAVRDSWDRGGSHMNGPFIRELSQALRGPKS